MMQSHSTSSLSLSLSLAIPTDEPAALWLTRSAPPPLPILSYDGSWAVKNGSLTMATANRHYGLSVPLARPFRFTESKPLVVQVRDRAAATPALDAYGRQLTQRWVLRAAAECRTSALAFVAKPPA